MRDAGHVITVDGPIDPGALGVTLTHEHLFVDLDAYFIPDPDPAIARALEGPLRMEHLGYLRRSLASSRDDLVLDDEALAAAEAAHFAVRAGGAICDVSPLGIRVADHGAKLQRVAAATGLHVIAGTGVYVERFHGDLVASRSEAELEDRFVAELDDGLDRSGARAGIIGEIGLGRPVHADEWKVLRAAAGAHLRTGAPIVLHQVDFSYATAHRALDELERLGVRLARVVVGHSSMCADDEPVLEAMRRGAFIALDTVGIVGNMGPVDFEFPSEAEYLRRIEAIVAAGLADHLLLSQDVAHKRSLHAYGGCGYDHLLATTVPALRARGIDEAILRTILADNPARMLTIGR